MFHKSQLTTALLALLAVAFSGVAAIIGSHFPGSNLLKKDQPLAITARDNNSLFFLPVKKAAVEALLPRGTPLLPSHPVPGFADDEWPLVFNPGLNQDVSLINTDFNRGYIGIGWTDKSKDGKTPFIYSFDVTSSFNPPISLGGELLAWFTFKTVDWQPKPGQYAFAYDTQSKSYYYNAFKDQHTWFDLEYVESHADPLPRSLYNDSLTHGRWQHGGCLYHEQFYNYTDTNPRDISANITVTDSWIPASVAGSWTNVRGLRLAQHWIETISQKCDKTAATHGSL